MKINCSLRTALLGCLITFGTSSALAQTDPATSTVGAIRGRITDASGKPLQGATISVFQNTGTDALGGPVAEMTAQATADAEGNYLAVGLRPGTYAMTAQYAGLPAQARPNVVIGDSQTATIDIQLGGHQQ